jgi:hypothetical protein
MKNTAGVTGGKPIADLSQSISGVSAINPLVTFYDIHGRKREVLFFCFVPDTIRDQLYTNDDEITTKDYSLTRKTFQSIPRFPVPCTICVRPYECAPLLKVRTSKRLTFSQYYRKYSTILSETAAIPAICMSYL